LNDGKGLRSRSLRAGKREGFPATQVCRPVTV
jgi:hypothetical protein